MKSKFISAVASVALAATMMTNVNAEWHPSQGQDDVTVNEQNSQITIGDSTIRVTSDPIADTGEPLIWVLSKSETTNADTKRIYEEALASTSTDNFLSKYDGLQQTVLEALRAKVGNDAKSEDLEMLSLFDIDANTLARELISQNGSVPITLSVPGIQTDGTYIVVHWKDDGTTEILEDSVPAEGQITVNMSTFSPVMILSYIEGSSVNNNTGNGADTSDSNNVLLFGGVLAVAVIAGGALIITRKKKFD